MEDEGSNPSRGSGRKTTHGGRVLAVRRFHGRRTVGLDVGRTEVGPDPPIAISPCSSEDRTVVSYATCRGFESCQGLKGLATRSVLAETRVSRHLGGEEM